MRPRKPSRKEIKAAIEWYQPIDWRIQPMDQMEKLMVHAHGACWYMYPKRGEHVCGNRECAYYSVVSNRSNVLPGGPKVNMWLCERHKKYVEKQGYACTPVTFTQPEPPPKITA